MTTRSAAVRSLTTGSIPGPPKEFMQISPFVPQAPHLPSPSSKCHPPLFGSNTPIFDFSSPNQSPTIGSELLLPKPTIHLSTPQSSKVPLPLRSRNHSPVLGRNTPMLVTNCGPNWNEALQVRFEVMTEFAQPAGVQPTKLEPAAAVANNVTPVPLL